MGLFEAPRAKKTSINVKADEIQQQNATSGLANDWIITRMCIVNDVNITYVYLNSTYFSFV